MVSAQARSVIDGPPSIIMNQSPILTPSPMFARRPERRDWVTRLPNNRCLFTGQCSSPWQPRGTLKDWLDLLKTSVQGSVKRTPGTSWYCCYIPESLRLGLRARTAVTALLVPSGVVAGVPKCRHRRRAATAFMHQIGDNARPSKPEMTSKRLGRSGRGGSTSVSKRAEPLRRWSTR